MSEKVGEFFRANWLIITGVVLCAVAWGTMAQQIAGLSKDQERILTKIDVFTESVATTKAATSYALQDINDLKVRVHVLEVRR